MPDPTRPTKLKRILNLRLHRILGKRLWGKAKRKQPTVQLNTLSVPDQHRVLTAAAEDHASVLAMFLGALNFVVFGFGWTLGESFEFDTGASFWFQPASNALSTFSMYAISLTAWWLLAGSVDSIVDRIMRYKLRRSVMVDPQYLHPREKMNSRVWWYALFGVLFVAWLILWAISGDYSTAGVIVLGFTFMMLFMFVCPVVFGWMYAKRFGTEPSCRQCGYSLPWEDPLPSNCSECGLDLSEPWRRVRGTRKPRGTRMFVAITFQVIGVVLGLAPRANQLLVRTTVENRHIFHT
jgi:hypothetical protein